MIVENQRGNLVDDDGVRDRFPVGMRVLAVDDDPICLKMLGQLLRKCQYHVTTTNQSIKALKMLRENKDKFDLVISDVNMPDMDGFQLLEVVGLEMDLPVIMLSAHSDTELVMKGVTHGACDYLLKPVRIEELKNIWQHVVRRKKIDCMDQNKASNEEKACNIAVEGGQGIASENNSDQNKKVSKKRKEQSEEEEGGDEEDGQENEDPSSQKKPRVVWSVELHKKFVAAVDQLGLEKAVPKKILDLMNVEGLTRENVASHLQKYRLYLKKVNQVGALGSSDSYLRAGSLDGYGDFRTLSGSGRISNTTLPSYASGGIFCRLNSPAGLSLRGITSSALARPLQSQNMNSSIHTHGNIHPSMFPANQSSSLLQAIPTSFELNHFQQSNCVTGIRQLSSIDDSSGFTISSGFQDTRATFGNATTKSLSGLSSSPLLLQGNSQQTQNSGVFRNQSSLRAASMDTESFDIGNCGSSNLLDYNRCNESWQSPSQLSKFPANNCLPLSEAFNDHQMANSGLKFSSSTTHMGNNPVEFSSTNALASTLEDARGELGNIVQASSYTPLQSWEEHKQDHNQNTNGTFNSINSLVPYNGDTSTLGHGLNQNNAICNKRMDASFAGQLNGATPSITPCTDVEKFYSDVMLKPQDDLIPNNFGSLDDIMSVKRDQNETLLMDGEMGFEAYTVGSCI